MGGHGEVDIGGIRMEEWNRTGGRMMNEIGWKEGERDKNQWVRYQLGKWTHRRARDARQLMATEGMISRGLPRGEFLPL